MKTTHLKLGEHHIRIECNSTEVVPGYLYYLLLYHKLPINYPVEFNDITVKLVKKDQKFEYERV